MGPGLGSDNHVCIRGDKTRLTTDLELRLSGFQKLTYPILSRRRIRDRDLSATNVKRILEARA